MNLFYQKLKATNLYIHKIKKSGKTDKDNKIYYHLFSLISYNLRRFLLNKETRNRNPEKIFRPKTACVFVNYHVSVFVYLPFPLRPLGG